MENTLDEFARQGGIDTLFMTFTKVYFVLSLKAVFG